MSFQLRLRSCGLQVLFTINHIFLQSHKNQFLRKNNLILLVCIPLTRVGSVCGDGVVEGGEECDGTAVPVTCESLGLGSGSVSCDKVT